MFQQLIFVAPAGLFSKECFLFLGDAVTLASKSVREASLYLLFEFSNMNGFVSFKKKIFLRLEVEASDFEESSLLFIAFRIF